MARAPSPSIDAVLREALADVAAPAAAELARSLAGLAAERIGDALEAALRRPGGLATPGGAGRRRATAGVTRWIADRRARRVPTFVIEATGLDTKRKIVERYGAGAAFEKGKPPPPKAR
jgi:hypothetical protein